ncbi:MAG: tetratricopeptide repeat protein [Gemmataceae bacterium]
MMTEPETALPPAAAPRPPLSRRKATLFRVLAVLLGLSPFVALEAACRIFDWGRPSLHDDPFVGFSEVSPLFVLEETSGRYVIPPARQTHFRPDSFAAKKPAHGCRIFVLGGSTVQGRPYAIETSFTTWLRLALEQADPTRTWEVVNCGGISYASYRLVPIMEELLEREPDLFIVCAGQNEFLEDRSYGHIKNRTQLVRWPSEQASRLRSFVLLRAGCQQLGLIAAPEITADRPRLGPEADARLDWKGGMKDYHRDDAWRADVMAHYEFNLRRMVALAQGAGVPVLLMNPVSNLDWPPFKAEPGDSLSAGQLVRVKSLREQARACRDEPQRSLELLLQARAIDGQHAGLLFDLGKCYQSLGMLDEARAMLQAAKDNDICPLRMLEPMKDTLRQVARETGTPLVDADALIAERSPGRIPGTRWLVDHVHPTIEGHQFLADELFDELMRQGFVKSSGPLDDRQRAYRKHLASLDTMYFVRGQRRLDAVQAWAHGQATWERDKK